MLSRNQSSCSASLADESASRSSVDFCGSSSPKILLTASRDGFGGPVTGGCRCDEDHILATLVVCIGLTIETIARARPHPTGTCRSSSEDWKLLDLQAG